MKYPNFLNRGDTISLVAPSYGSPIDPYKIRLKQGIENFEAKAFKIKKGSNIFKLDKEESNTPKKRANEFMDAYLSKSNFVWSVAGGELMTLILPFIDRQKLINATPKWFMGYSDNTILTHYLTTACDVASIYSYHIGAFCPQPWPRYLTDVYDLMCGKKFEFDSYSYYEIQDLKDDNPLCSLNLTEPVKWENLISKRKTHFSGRCIGGCLDVLVCIANTKYDYTKEFLNKYQHDGFVWYFDICELSPVALSRALFQLKASDWFNNVKGFIFSRIPQNPYKGDLTYKDVILSHLKDYDVPILFNCDLGHIPPSIPFINGSIVDVTYDNNKGSIKFNLK